MKVLHIITSLPRKDWPRNTFIKSQIESLRKLDIDIDIFEINNPPKTMNYLFAFFRLRKILKKDKYDLIHAHYIYPGLTAISQKKIPVIFSYMGSEILGTPNKKGRITFLGYFNIFISKILQYLVDEIIVKSKNLLEELNTNKPTYIVPNGVDFSVFKQIDRFDCRKKLGLAEDLKIILFLGRLKDPRKNYKLAKYAVEDLNQNSNIGQKFVLLAPDSIPPEQVPIYINASNVVLQTSLWEGSPNIIKEAMACNIPIVSTNVGDVSNTIKNTSGCYITNFDYTEVSKSIIKAFDFDNRTTGREDISHLKIDKIANQINNIYKGLLSNKLG